MDTVAERIQYALELREKSAHALAQQLKTLNVRRNRQGREPLPWANKERIYELLAGKKTSTPVEFIETVAAILRVRRAWLAFSEGPCEADGPADEWRELYLVDGKLRRFKPPEDPKDRNRIRKGFEAGFKDAESFHRVSYTVQVVFANYMARYFERCREEGLYQDDATWRGKEAAIQFNRAVDMVRTRIAGEPEDEPLTTGALLWALGSWEMQRPPEG